MSPHGAWVAGHGQSPCKRMQAKALPPHLTVWGVVSCRRALAAKGVLGAPSLLAPLDSPVMALIRALGMRSCDLRLAFAVMLEGLGLSGTWGKPSGLGRPEKPVAPE